MLPERRERIGFQTAAQTPRLRRTWYRTALGVGTMSFLLAGCSESDGSAVDGSTPEALAESTDCTSVSELDPMIAPIRGQAATRGIRCDIDGEVLHIFARAPHGDPSAATYAAEQGGSLENIHRLVRGEPAQSSCSVSLVVSEDVFVLGAREETLSDLGLPGEPPIAASPTVSYLDDCVLD